MLGDGFTILLLLFFFLTSGDTLLRRLVEVLPTWEDKKRAVGIASEIEDNVASYLATITVMNLLVGTLNGLQVWLLGMPNPLLFGTMAFLLNYIPILGPLTGVRDLRLRRPVHLRHPLFALVPAGIYLAIHVLGGRDDHPHAAGPAADAQPRAGDRLAVLLGLDVGGARRAALRPAARGRQDRVRPAAGAGRASATCWARTSRMPMSAEPPALACPRRPAR